MKKYPLLILVLFSAFFNSFAQYAGSGSWTVTPFPNEILKITWTYNGQKRTEQVSNAVILKPQATPVTISGDKSAKWPQQSFLVSKMGAGIQVKNGQQIIKFTTGFDSFHLRGIRVAMPGDAPWFGGGERATSLIRNGQRISLYNAPAYGYGEGQDQLNYSVPFVMTSEGYGLFFDNPSKGYIDFGKTTGGILEAAFVSGSLDVYVIPGKTPGEIIEHFTILTGKQPLPPRWAFGNFVSRFGYRSQQQAESVIAKMKEDHFPMDAIILDLFWFGDSIQNTLGNLDWNRQKWPEPEKMISNFKKDNINTILITEPFTIEGTKEYKNSIPFLATDSFGKPFRLTEFYFGKGGIIDLFRKPARDWFWKFYKKQSDIGVAGWWGDLGEPEHHPNGVMHDLSDMGANRKMEGNEVHNLFGHVWSQMVSENWKKDYPAKRLFFLNRAGYAGSQRFSIFPWTGDVGRSWSGFRAQLPTLQSMSMSGVPYIHSDAGGFAMTDKADAELYTRWLQFAAFSPIFRPHGSALGADLTPSGTVDLPSEPTFWDLKTKERILNIIKERYHLLPYHYTMAWEQTTLGKPLIRPMMLENRNDTNLLKATDQYMWGDALLVAPVLQPGAKTRKLYLPKGNWYQYYDLKMMEGSKWVEVETNMEQIPVFVEGGSFIPYWSKNDVTSTSDYDPTGPLSLRYYPGENNASFYVYDDDGITPDAEIMEGKHQLMEWKSEKKGNTLVLKGVFTGTVPFPERMLEIQIPVLALKKFLNARNSDKFKVLINGDPYSTIVINESQEVWMSIDCVTFGKGTEIKISNSN